MLRSINIVKKRFILASVFLAAAPLYSAGGQDRYADAQQIFLTEEGALKTVFTDGTSVSKETMPISETQKKAIETRLGWSLQEKSVELYSGLKDGVHQGYALIMEEIGKFKPITFIVKTNPMGKVENVEVMVYRESVGADVRRARFTRQFKGKAPEAPLRINRDIVNITGATMSVQAMTAGVKKALVMIDELAIKPKGISK